MNASDKPGLPVLVDRYQLRRVIARGGMGVVFSALDTRTGQRVAVKLIKPSVLSTPELRERFKREVRAVLKLCHPNIVEVWDWGEDEKGAPYLVTELLRGRTLGQELRERGTLPVDEALACLSPVMGALAYAHDRGVVHRDVKPENIFLCEKHEGSRCSKLLDFGVARCHDSTPMTESGMAIGTLEYMAPEQILSGEAGASVDIWAMGAVMYHCLAGSLPYSASSVQEYVDKITQNPAAPLADRAPELPPPFCVMVERALQHHLSRRFADIRTMAHALLVAAIAAGIPVPDAPDPLGLPHWPEWRKAAERSDSGTRGV